MGGRGRTATDESQDVKIANQGNAYCTHQEIVQFNKTLNSVLYRSFDGNSLNIQYSKLIVRRFQVTKGTPVLQHIHRALTSPLATSFSSPK